MSRVCLGGMQLGQAFSDFHQWVIDREGAQAVIERAIERGANFFDTANGYSHGTSERFIGESLRSLGVPRGVVIASRESIVFARQRFNIINDLAVYL